MDEQKELMRNVLFSSTNMAAMTSPENHLLVKYKPISLNVFFLNQPVLTDCGTLNKQESIPLFKYFSYDSLLHDDHSVEGVLLKEKFQCHKCRALTGQWNTPCAYYVRLPCFTTKARFQRAISEFPKQCESIEFPREKCESCYLLENNSAEARLHCEIL